MNGLLPEGNVTAGDLLRQDFDWPAEVAKISAQAMLVYADASRSWTPHRSRRLRHSAGEPIRGYRQPGGS